MLRIRLVGDIKGLEAGFDEIKNDLGLEISEDGFFVHAKKEDCLRVCFMENKAEIGYA